ncbi:TnsA endonuclease N-terminal domain-containing protein [Paenibacillus sedimenti]|uniref:Tn7 transposase TnsA N-terminal domain-containing protein n=1 Tax=Paenibacillus sedimenti TaxID=2770274 RepID=A0A926KNA1_9BACL|nr:TnsA endonuclease N-terminal domain-containing protein [Paenibacillus sedimenti]MBD0380987.1 Tn7 transposase TnsA N-terminal domain-containing protein [Paenibacillus sedimenti]
MRFPARKIRPTKGRNYRCKVTQSKNAVVIYSESLLERDYVRLCNFDPSIERIYFQPLGIKYNYLGRTRKYFPDYLLITKDDRYVLVEVKLKQFVNSDLNKAKFLAASEFCRQKEWTFHVVTEDQIRTGFLQRNINLLLEVKAYKVIPAIAEYIKTILDYRGPITIQDFISITNCINNDLIIIQLYKLIYSNEIITDLVNYELSLKSIIWLRK